MSQDKIYLKSLNSKSVKITVPARMTRPSSDELIPWEAGAGVGVGAFVGDDGEQTSFGEGSLELLSC